MASTDRKSQSFWHKMTKKARFMAKKTKLRYDFARGVAKIEIQLLNNVHLPGEVNRYYFGTYRDYFLDESDIFIARLFQRADQVRDSLSWTEYEFSKIQARRKQQLWVAERMALIKAVYGKHADACKRELVAAYWRARSKLEDDMNNNEMDDGIVMDPVYPQFRFTLD